jgi:uncharacterized repeat protein (TIGR04042 family)
MPEVLLTLEWPDGQRSQLYSPSSVILNFLPPGQSLQVRELLRRGEEALLEASERVRARYGFSCTRAEEERARLRQQGEAFDGDQIVTVVGLHS